MSDELAKKFRIVMEKRTAALVADRKFVLEERDRTFALMLARAEAAEAERDRLREVLDETAQILSQCTFETIRVHGQYIDRREAVSRARAALKGETP